MSVGSVEYSGMINQVPDAKASPEEFKGVHQAQLASIEGQLREEKQETVIEADQTYTDIKDKQKEGSSRGTGGQQKAKEEALEEESSDYFVVEDDDKGQYFDFSA